ncbi:MAG: hypothetical protein EPN25_13445 [Nitrospirae bacterium]|nr:MAG: hypothetical protein EPN25_13445 [Nitrospirota bacterium]
MRTLYNYSTWAIIALLLILSGTARAKNDAGSVVAVRGKAVIERDKKSFDARVKDTVQANDIISTADASRAKMLFIDDSVLTLGEKSRVSIREFIQGKDKGDRSIFNLIDGKMRSVVGRAGFEVHTPTAVAAARGTIVLFETGVINGKKFTTVIFYEGEGTVVSSDPNIPGNVTLKQGMMITLIEGEPIGEPRMATEAEIQRLLKDTDVSGGEISVPGPAIVDLGGWELFFELPYNPLWNQQNVNRVTPVNINITFPQ